MGFQKMKLSKYLLKKLRQNSDSKPTVMDKYDGFESWLKTNNYVSWKSYISFMHQIEKTLFVKDFDKITSVKVLQSLFNDLQKNRSFMARSKSDRDNISSGFRTYIEYIIERKQS